MGQERTQWPDGRILVLLLALLLALALNALPARAAGVVGSGTPASCTEAALRAAVEQGGTITFNCGSAPHTITLSDEIRITSDTVIDGGGTAQGGLMTLSGGGTSRIFSTDQEIGITLRNLTLTDGKSPGNGEYAGGALFTGWRTTLEIDNCIFENNDGTAGNLERGGGAITTDSEGSVTIRNSLFRNNRGANGGAINSLLSGFTLENTIFINNDSTSGADSAGKGAGGAVYIDGASKNDGKTKGIVDIKNCIFRGNKSAVEGGTVFSWVYEPDQVYIDRVLFENNTTEGYGGALRHGNGFLSLSNSLFVGNTAHRQGGAFWISKTPNGVLTNVTFVGNEATRGADDGGYGGAVAGTGDFRCVNCTFANNHAEEYGGAIYEGGDITLKNTIFVGNSSSTQWGLRQTCSESYNDDGGNFQFPSEDLSDDKNKNCTADITIADEQLEALADNGGATKTMALKRGSPAIDAGEPAGCPGTDQRGAARPFDGDGDGTPVCDSGAFEYGATPSEEPRPTPTPDPGPRQNPVYLVPMFVGS